MLNKVLSFGRSSPALLFVVVWTAILAGCFGDFAPTAPSNDDVKVEQPRSNGSVYLAFSPQTLQRATKLVDDGINVSKDIGPGGGTLTIEDKNSAGPEDDVKINLVIPKNAVTQKVKITMTVYGSSLETLVVAFEPSGLNFLTAATLVIGIGDALVSVPLSEITAYHQYSDGTVVEATILSVVDSGPSVTITISVPGFSRYGLAD